MGALPTKRKPGSSCSITMNQQTRCQRYNTIIDCIQTFLFTRYLSAAGAQLASNNEIHCRLVDTTLGNSNIFVDCFTYSCAAFTCRVRLAVHLAATYYHLALAAAANIVRLTTRQCLNWDCEGIRRAVQRPTRLYITCWMMSCLYRKFLPVPLADRCAPSHPKRH